MSMHLPVGQWRYYRCTGCGATAIDQSGGRIKPLADAKCPRCDGEMIGETTPDEQEKWRELHQRWLNSRQKALEAYIDERLPREIGAILLRYPDRVAFVEQTLYYDDEPEGRKLVERLIAIDKLYTRLRIRCENAKRIADEWMNDDDGNGSAQWDAIRLQRGETHRIGSELLAEIAALVFSLDQWASARYVWVSTPQERGE